MRCSSYGVLQIERIAIDSSLVSYLAANEETEKKTHHLDTRNVKITRDVFTGFSHRHRAILSYWVSHNLLGKLSLKVSRTDKKKSIER